jgi:hypothetical protein
MKARLTIITFFLFLLIPSITLLTAKQTKVYLGNKLLQGKAFKEAEENVRLRKEVKLWQKIYELYVPILYKLNISPNKKLIITGVDGWVFLSDRHDKEYSQAKKKINFTQEQAQSVVSKISILQNIAKKME